MGMINSSAAKSKAKAPSPTQIQDIQNQDTDSQLDLLPSMLIIEKLLTLTTMRRGSKS